MRGMLANYIRNQRRRFQYALPCRAQSTLDDIMGVLDFLVYFLKSIRQAQNAGVQQRLRSRDVRD
jgi:hypothetical protein